MARFAWQGKTKSGAIQKGIMEAANEEAVMAKLRSQEISPVSGSVKPAGIDFSKDLGEVLPFMAQKVTGKDIIVFTRQFATMIDAGLPLVQCLELLSAEMENKTFKKTLRAVKEQVESGSTFADALAKHPKVFDNLYVQMVKAGEIGGILDTILNRLALSMEKTERLKKQITSAMVYPAIILTVAVAVIGILLVFVIPMFEQMFADMGAELPTLTQYVVNLSRWLIGSYGWAWIGGTVIVLTAIFYAVNSQPKGRFFLHSMYLKIPIIGDLISKTAVASFTRTLGTLISSGVPIMDGLDIVAAVSGNMVVEKELRYVKSSISEGKTLSDPLKESKIFPNMVVQMIGVGEQTGALDAMLSKIADFYEEEVDDAVATLTSMMEPLLMVFLGVAVGAIAIAMYLPIFSMANVVG